MNNPTGSGNQKLAVPAACLNVNPCTDTSCQLAVAQAHRITAPDFAGRIKPSAGPGKVYSRQDMQTILDSGTCGADYIVLNPNLTQNSQIVPVSAPMPSGSLRFYSYVLFNGIMLQDPTSYTFFLAVSPGHNDVIFSAQFDGQPEQYFNASNEVPFCDDDEEEEEHEGDVVTVTDDQAMPADDGADTAGQNA